MSDRQRMRTNGVAAGVAATLLAAVAGGVGRADEAPVFSGQRAFAHLEAIAGLGPRPSGSAAMVKQRQLLAAHFRAAGGTVREIGRAHV